MDADHLGAEFSDGEVEVEFFGHRPLLIFGPESVDQSVEWEDAVDGAVIVECDEFCIESAEWGLDWRGVLECSAFDFAVRVKGKRAAVFFLPFAEFVGAILGHKVSESRFDRVFLGKHA